MTAISNVKSNLESKHSIWHSIVTLTLGFWLSASLVLDWVIMPSLYVSGMMLQDSFAAAGYSIFWAFNRVELLAASLVLAGILFLLNTRLLWNRGIVVLAVLLLDISLVDTYFLTPQMSAVGMNLDLFNTDVQTPLVMNLLHGSYWVLEIAKFALGTVLLKWCLRQKI
jgi:hypothetical protein